MTTQSVDTPRSTTGSAELLSFVHTKVLEEEKAREEKLLKENPSASPPLSRREKLAHAINNHSRLCLGQKEQAMEFLFHPAYAKDGYAIARQYVKLCLNPKYTARGTSWKGAENKRLPFKV
jgi:hypothetical protein